MYTRTRHVRLVVQGEKNIKKCPTEMKAAHPKFYFILVHFVLVAMYVLLEHLQQPNQLKLIKLQ